VTFDVQAYSNVWFYANPIFVRPEGSPKLLVEAKCANLAKRLAGRGGDHDDDHGRDDDHGHDKD